MFSYVSPEQRVPSDHPLRSVLQITDYDFGFDHLYFGLGGVGSDALNVNRVLGSNPFASLFGSTEVCFNGSCGYNVISFGNYYEVVSAPVPEPMTLSLLGLGLIGLGWRRRRQTASSLRSRTIA